MVTQTLSLNQTALQTVVNLDSTRESNWIARIKRDIMSLATFNVINYLFIKSGRF